MGNINNKISEISTIAEIVPRASGTQLTRCSVVGVDLQADRARKGIQAEPKTWKMDEMGSGEAKRQRLENCWYLQPDSRSGPEGRT